MACQNAIMAQYQGTESFLKFNQPYLHIPKNERLNNRRRKVAKRGTSKAALQRPSLFYC